MHLTADGITCQLADLWDDMAPKYQCRMISHRWSTWVQMTQTTRLSSKQSAQRPYLKMKKVLVDTIVWPFSFLLWPSGSGLLTITTLITVIPPSGINVDAVQTYWTNSRVGYLSSWPQWGWWYWASSGYKIFWRHDQVWEGCNWCPWWNATSPGPQFWGPSWSFCNADGSKWEWKVIIAPSTCWFVAICGEHQMSQDIHSICSGYPRFSPDMRMCCSEF